MPQVDTHGSRPHLLWAGLAVVTAGLLLLLRPVCRKLRLVDHPSERKQHGESVPLAGGVAFMLVMSPPCCAWPQSRRFRFS
jgi:UDP-N-acetylmuramyl pentapeptide phosphotransferase/UDP-N-acetylglucosamine-1-phosphate transferase